MNDGRYIFSQVLDFLPRYVFDKAVTKYKGNKHAKSLSCYNQLLHLLFGQITGCSSIRDICLCLEAHREKLFHMGFRNTVNPSNLSRANENRDYRIYEELGMYLIELVRPLYAGTPIKEITIDNVCYALDSTTISTSIKLATWAFGKYSKGAVKMHTLLDLRGSIPISIHITDGKWHDSNELDEITPEPSAFYMADKAYVDFKALYRFHKAGSFWICRPKDNMRYDVIEYRRDIDLPAGITGDFIITLKTAKSKGLYPEPMRMVCYYDSEVGEEIKFITNNMDVKHIEVANLYRHRWDIEVFFKWIKQNIVVKTLWGYSENAVRIHLWTAIIAYLIIARIKADTRTTYSITEVATLIRISALEKISIRDLLIKSKPQIYSNQDVKERSLFDDV